LPKTEEEIKTARANLLALLDLESKEAVVPVNDTKEKFEALIDDGKLGEAYHMPSVKSQMSSTEIANAWTEFSVATGGDWEAMYELDEEARRAERKKSTAGDNQTVGGEWCCSNDRTSGLHACPARVRLTAASRACAQTCVAKSSNHARRN
jgi:hypothetical protein